jgi:hypothetical protein
MDQFVKNMNAFQDGQASAPSPQISPSGGSKEPRMNPYEINYLKHDGSLAAKFTTQCSDDTQAKVLAHAMKLDGARQIEVWQGQTLIYTRPQHPH